ncbi:hypothetical protein [Salinicola endophyticus]|uniref:Uncharacterized protein n=1 Tax=Salinicola endophyticus TaxID=1949083 RepID=A0AB74U8F8_9GAMM
MTWLYDLVAAQTLTRERYLAQGQDRAASLCWVIMPINALGGCRWRRRAFSASAASQVEQY